MNSKFTVKPRTFSAIQTVNVCELSALSEAEIRPILPCLVRMSLCGPLDLSSEWGQKRQIILKTLSGIELVNSLVALLSIDFHGLEIDVKKELQLRLKIGGHTGESVLVSSLQNGLSLEFERSEPSRRLRLLLSELCAIMAQTKENRTDFCLRSSELFDSEIYLDEVSDVLCIAQAELPGLLPLQDIAEALLHLKNGPVLLTRLVANAPDSFREVCYSLLANGEKQDEESKCGRIRMQAIRLLCQMSMSQALAIRAKAVELCRMPGLAILLTLDYAKHRQGNTDFDSEAGGLVAFVSGLLLGSDDKVRSWFAQYVRTCQKQKVESSGAWTLHPLREELVQRLQNLVLFGIDQHNLPECKVVQASCLLRLYCALRGIASLKFHEDEIDLLLQLLTSHPPPSPPGIRFVTLGLCMLLACPSLLGTGEHEKLAVQWIHWLLREEDYFGRVSGVSASFGEMLLLMAIHFHSNQLTSISELVSSTIGMKVPLRPNNLARAKTIFTQEIFTEQVVTAHAVRVPFTPNLNGNTPGFLPVHCIHQLLRSRAFTKHKVPIKDWIYKQICSTTTPLHPVLPALVEVYVNSVLTPSSKASHDTTNEPITEEEIRAVFRHSIFAEDAGDCEGEASLTSQLLLLYYLLLYEDTRLNNMKSISASGRSVKRYSPQFLAQLPVFYLVRQAKGRPQELAGLFAPLLALLATHYPQLCLVEDWLQEADPRSCISTHNRAVSQPDRNALVRAFGQVGSCPVVLLSHLDHLLSLSLHYLWPYSLAFVSQMPVLLEDGIPRQVVEKAKQLWLRLNATFPRRLWVMTVNAFRTHPLVMVKPLTWDDIVLDPLHVLRCNGRIFRCPPILEVTIRMLKGCLAASRTHLAHHLLEHPLVEKTGQLESEKEREELRITLVAAQQSAAVQILLESCLTGSRDKGAAEGLLTSQREVQSLVCSYLHQVFIADTALAKLVHFQGYPSELLPMAVASIPSMHICLDFIPELLSQPHLHKQVFAIELASHLSLQYAIPKSLSISKLCIGTVYTLLAVLTSERRASLLIVSLPSLVRMCRSFPPLCDEVASLLLQIGRIERARQSLSATVPSSFSEPLAKKDMDELQTIVSNLPSDTQLNRVIQSSFSDLCELLLDRTIY